MSNRYSEQPSLPDSFAEVVTHDGHLRTKMQRCPQRDVTLDASSDPDIM